MLRIVSMLATVAAWAGVIGVAAAGTVTAPVAGVYTIGQPLTVSWNGVPSSSGQVTIGVTLTGSSNTFGTYSLPWATGVSNSGTYVGALPMVLCSGKAPFETPTSQWTAHIYVIDANVSGQMVQGPAIQLRCPVNYSGYGGPATLAGGGHLSKEVRTGTLAVTKVVVNATGGPAPAYPDFEMTVRCGAPGAKPDDGAALPIHTVAGRTLSLPAAYPVGTVCRVAEIKPPPIRGLRACLGHTAVWTTAYSPPATIAPESQAVLTVTNTLSCSPR